ncbi:lamin tail domain-containing protein [Akkermansiaceae bacterium]|nr:lamin tail domain-containing protein [Akkermansiaceae bacterium]
MKKFLSLFLCSLIPVSADLVAHYALDETDASTKVIQDSLQLNNGLLIGNSNPTKNFRALHGTGYDFPLRSGFRVNPALEVQPTDQFTITWWFRPTTLNAFDRFYETLSGTGKNGSGIRIDLGGNGRQVRALLRDGNGSTDTSVTSPLNLTAGAWYFFALRYDSLNNFCKVTVLRDTGGNITASNISSSTTTKTSLGTNTITHNTGVFFAADDASAAGSNDFGGAMDDIAIFQTKDDFGVLSDTDLAGIFNNGALAFDPPAPRPTINSFTANLSDFDSGNSVVLRWDVSGADSVEITPNIGAVSETGSVNFTATLTEIYTLTATNAEGPTSATVQITVDGLALAPQISEFVASNSSFDDGDGNSNDWIEINNRNTTPFDISGYYLTDDETNLTKWSFPNNTILDGNEYFVVFASGSDTPDSAGNLHTNFNLSAKGEYLALISPDGATIVQQFSPTYPPQKTDASYTSQGFLPLPTPGSENTGIARQGYVRDTTFNVDRGHYQAPFEVTIKTTTANSQIYYTLNGTRPTPDNGDLYSGPVTISTTTILRAAGFKNNFIPTNVDTQSYIFLKDVINQPKNPPNTTSVWAGRIADYEMDPQIVDDPKYAAEIIPALQKFPSLSLTIAPDDFYGPNGIYQNPQSEGSLWERPVSAELISHDDSEPGFKINAGLRVQGGSSRNPDTPKHSMSLRFRSQYGAGKLRYPLYRDAPSGRKAAGKFDTLQLRSNYNYGFSHRHFWQCDKAQYNRDQFTNDVFMELGNIGVHGRWTHLYINGIYWGLYHLHERPDQDFMEAYFGGEDADYDAINKGQAQSGTVARYNTMASISRNNIASNSVYEILQSHLDIDSFIDYMILNFFIGNNDWDGNNWRAAGMGPTGVPFHYFPWDSEFAISTARNSPAYLNIAGALNINVTGRNNRNNRASGIHQDLTKNAEYRLRFADRAHVALFNNGPLSPTGATAIWRRRSDEMDDAIVAESARWGDYRRDVQSAGGWQNSNYELYTKDDQYLATQNYIIETHLKQRPNILLNQLRARNLYPSVAAPVYAQNGNSLTIENPNGAGSIFYTTNGLDPRDLGALTYSNALTLTVSATYKSRVLENGVWSALQSADLVAGTPADATNLVISELYYNEPGSAEENEFIELTNISNNEIDLSNLTFTAGLTYTFPLDTTLSPGGRLTIGTNDFAGSLDNGGEKITLTDASGTVIESFAFDDTPPWPQASDGEGFSLVRISPSSQLDPNLPSSWRTSTTAGGNPGGSDATTFQGGDLIAYALQGKELTPTLTGIQVPKNLAADDLIQKVQISNDLKNWDTLSNPIQESLPENGFIVETYEVGPITQARFYRLKVTVR